MARWIGADLGVWPSEEYAHANQHNGWTNKWIPLRTGQVTAETSGNATDG